MQKKLLTMAVAGALAGPGLALAQSSVEVYGTLYPTFGLAKYGEGFTAHVSQGDDVTAGQVVITYDVPSVEAKGLNPVVPVVVMDEREPGNIIPSEAVTAGADIVSGASLFTANK